MSSGNPYAAGTNVYRGGSSVATMGPVNPTGYVNRELNNRRSQLAQGMLQNMGNPNKSSPQGMSPFQLDPKNVSLLAIRSLRQGGI